MKGRRIKLTDAELAIAMWTYILLFVKAWEGEYEDAPSIAKLKLEYLLSHGVGYDHWINDCYLCSKYYSELTDCKCPLNEEGKCCGVGSAWGKACEYDLPSCKEEAIKAIKKILKVTIKEYENEKGMEEREKREVR